MGENSGLLKVSQATLADLYEQIGSSVMGVKNVCERLEETNKRLSGLPCTLHGERLAKVETRMNGAEMRSVEQVQQEEDVGQTRSPSNLYAAVGAKIDKRSEEVTERIAVVARDAVTSAIEERAAKEAIRLKTEREEEATRLKQENERELQKIDLQHKRAMNWLKVVAAAVALLGGGTFATMRAMFSTTEAAQVETQKTLKRIEAKQAKLPDASVRP